MQTAVLQVNDGMFFSTYAKRWFFWCNVNTREETLKVHFHIPGMLFACRKRKLGTLERKKLMPAIFIRNFWFNTCTPLFLFDCVTFSVMLA